MPILSEFRKQRQGNFEFEASLGYTATPRLAVIHTEQNPASNKQDASQSLYAVPCRMSEQCPWVQHLVPEAGREENQEHTYHISGGVRLN